MRTFLLILVIMALAGYAYATDPLQMRAEEPHDVPPRTDIFYVQPPHATWWSINASTGFGSEVADDLPDPLYCYCVGDVDFYVAVWGGCAEPLGVYVRFYDAECPPPLGAPIAEYYFTWAECMPVVVYDDPCNMTIYYCIVILEPAIHIEYDMSISFQVHNDWGDAAPYCGITMTNDYDVYGDCEIYGDWAYWGLPRWTSGTAALGIPTDIAFSLSEGWPSAAEASTWGHIKSLYR